MPHDAITDLSPSFEPGSMLEMAVKQVRRAAEALELDTRARRRFLAPARIVEVTVPDPREGDGVITAIRVQHSNEQGPSKGGVRMSGSVTRTEVEALALLMTLKTSAVSLPLGGGKAGIIADAGSFDDEQREQLMADLARAWAPVIGPDHDVLGPDVGTGPAEMAALHRSWQQATGQAGSPATGKPIDEGGLALRDGATARGLDVVFAEVVDELGLGDGLRIAVHGYGSVGRGIARRLVDRGHRLVAVSDSGGATFDADGIDLDQLDERKNDKGSVSNGSHPSEEVLTTECDVLIPAALQGVIDSDVAGELQASIVLEGANGPCTWSGAETLIERGVTTIPDILANSGGVSASYEEMTPPADRDAADVIAKRLDDRLADATRTLLDKAGAESLDLRTAATASAMDRALA